MTTIGKRDAWVLARLLCGKVSVPDGSIEPVDESDVVRSIAERLRAVESGSRMLVWDGFLAAQADPDAWIDAIGNADPCAPPPEAEGRANAPVSCATLGDLKRMVADTSWPWPGWLAGGVLNSLAADPGVGKTILAMNLARVLWHGRPWPDGQINPFPPRTRTLWVPGDRHYTQLLDLAERYGLDDDALLFNAPADKPADGLDLDEAEVRDALYARVKEQSPGLVIVDTVGMTTDRNLGRPEEARAYFGPLMTMAGESGVPFLLLTHLSRDAQALGRRIVGACRVVWKLTHPDPDGQPDRRRFWVDKSYTVVPKPLGMTISDQGCTFDGEPPIGDGGKVGRPPAQLEKCKRWLNERLTAGPASSHSIREAAKAEGFSKTMTYVAIKALGITEFARHGKKSWMLPDSEGQADDRDPELVFPEIPEP